MAEENYDYNPLENSEDFTTNGGDSSFAQEPQESVQFQQPVEPEMTAPGTEDDLNGASEFQHQTPALEHESPSAQPVTAPGEHEQQMVSDAGPPPGTEDPNSQEPSNIQDGPRPHRPEDTDKKLFVGGLTWDTTAAQIREHFEQYGEIENVDLKLDMEGHSRGFAFVQFTDPSIIDKVIKIGEHRINNKTVDPKPANPRGKRRMPPEEEPMKKVFVGGITPELDDDTIRQHFMQYGEVDQVDRPRTVGPQKKRYLFVTFFEEEAAKRSIAECKQNIGGIMCDVNKATPKQDFGGRGQYGDRWEGGYGYGPRGRGGPPPRGRGRGGYGPPDHSAGYDPYSYSGYDPYSYDPNYYGGYDPNYYGGYDYSGYGGYDPNYYGGYGYDWSSYYGQGYDYSGYYGGQAPPSETGASGEQAAAAYDGGKAKRGAPAASAGYHPYRKQ